MAEIRCDSKPPCLPGISAVARRMSAPAKPLAAEALARNYEVVPPLSSRRSPAPTHQGEETPPPRSALLRDALDSALRRRRSVNGARGIDSALQRDGLDRANSVRKWDSALAVSLAPEACTDMLFEKVLVLDGKSWTSLTSAVEALNAGELTVQAGYCIVFSKSRQMHYLLWRYDKLSEALSLLHATSADSGAMLGKNAAEKSSAAANLAMPSDKAVALLHAAETHAAETNAPETSQWLAIAETYAAEQSSAAASLLMPNETCAEPRRDAIAADVTGAPETIDTDQSRRAAQEIATQHGSDEKNVGAWSTERCAAMGHDSACLQKLLEGDYEVLLLGQARWSSVTAVVTALEAGSLKASGGLCVVLSKSMNAVYLLWRQDKESDITPLFAAPFAQDTPCISTPRIVVPVAQGASPKRSNSVLCRDASPSSQRKQARMNGLSRNDSLLGVSSMEQASETPAHLCVASTRSLAPVELHFTDQFDFMEPRLQGKLFSLLHVAPSTTIEELSQPGGLNLGVWALQDFSASPAKSWILKLVKSDRDESQKFMRLSQDIPALMEDPTLAFPLSIIHCIGDDGAKVYDIIVMPRVCGSTLGDVMGALWWTGQAVALMSIIEKVGTCLAEFHDRHGHQQHSDFQPSNIYYDEVQNMITFIDLADIGPEGRVADNDVEHFLQSLKLVSKAYGPKFLEDAERHFLAGYAKRAP